MFKMLKLRTYVTFKKHFDNEPYILVFISLLSAPAWRGEQIHNLSYCENVGLVSLSTSFNAHMPTMCIYGGRYLAGFVGT